MPQNFDTLLQTISHYKLFPPGTRLLVAVSGGADSIALLHWLARHQDPLQLSIYAASLNHGLRPEAKDDIDYVQSIAVDLNIPCITDFVDVPAIAQANKTGIETAARKARYDFLAKTAQQIGASHIATAHHADDQSETILMHILRGSGTQGLTGMSTISILPYHTDMTLVRPLLHIRRAEIENYCAEHNLQPRIDKSNFDTQYFRNEIRHEILPRLRQINPQLDTALGRLADIVSTEQQFMAQNYQKYFKVKANFGERITLSLTEFQKWHAAMQGRFFLDALSHFKIESAYDSIQNAITLAMKGQVGTISEFSGDVRLRIGYDNLYIEPVSLAISAGDYLQIDRTYEITVPSETKIGDKLLIVSDTELEYYDVCMDIPTNAKITLRTRQPGDSFMPSGMGGHSRTIKKWLIDNKIPAFIRDALPLLIIDNIITAIILPGRWRIAEPFAKNETSQHKVYFKVSKL